MTARKPTVVANNAFGDLAAGDTLDPVACFGYTPARPVTTFSNAGSGYGIAANTNNQSLLTLTFVATASNYAITAFADVKSQGGSTEFTMFGQINDNTAGSTIQNSNSSGCYITTSASNGGNVAISLVGNNLTVGHTYGVTLYGSATSVAVTVNACMIGGVNQ